MRVVHALWIMGLCSSIPSFADQFDSETDLALFDLSLAQLLSVEVVSKEDEPVSRSPAVVSTYAIDQLLDLGLIDLLDFIDFVPSVEVNEALNGSRIIQMRGLPSRSNQKILFLIDGVPYWAAENGDIPLLGMPLASLERIEVIRGPGSVVYGTNASAGVINLVTRSEVFSSLRVTTDVENKTNTSLYHASQFDNGALWSISGEWQEDEGYDFQVENAFNIDPPFSFAQTYDGEMTRQSEYYSLYSKLEWQGFQMSVQAYAEDLLGSINSTPLVRSDYKNTGRMVSLRYRHEFDAGELEVFSDWNQFYRQIYTEDLLSFFFIPGDGRITFDNGGDNNDRLRQGMTWKSKPLEHWSLLAGYEYERRRTENQKFHDDRGGASLAVLPPPPDGNPYVFQLDGSILLVEGGRAYEQAGYVQSEYQDENWRVVLGARYVDNNRVGSDISPRGAVVYSMSDEESIKVLFSEGFNSPTFGQIAATTSFGAPTSNDVNAETIKSWDIAYTKTDKYDHFVLNFFRVEAEGLIFDTVNLDESIIRNGLELEWISKHGEWDLISGMTYVHQGNGVRDEQSMYASQWLMKWGAQYQVGAHSFGSSLRSAGIRKNVDSSHRWNANYRYSINSELSASLSLINLLDEKAKQPNVRQLNEIILQSTDRMGFLMGLQYRFD